jgi:hypothetical protein
LTGKYFSYNLHTSIPHIRNFLAPRIQFCITCEPEVHHDQIEETNVYKYLGVYFSRSLIFTYHIETFINENVQKKLNYMTRILGEHGNFNRISFGDSLWTSIIRPSIAHGCAVWFPSAISSAQNIESLQYQAGKIILKTKKSFPKSTNFREREKYTPKYLSTFSSSI